MITRKTRRIAGHRTLELARYEVGNAIVKENRVFKTLTQGEAEELTMEAANLISRMDVLSIGGAEEAVTCIALGAGLTYYDAAYLYVAKTLGLKLATEDKRLVRSAEEAGLETAGLEELA